MLIGTFGFVIYGTRALALIHHVPACCKGNYPIQVERSRPVGEVQKKIKKGLYTEERKNIGDNETIYQIDAIYIVITSPLACADAS